MVTKSVRESCLQKQLLCGRETGAKNESTNSTLTVKMYFVFISHQNDSSTVTETTAKPESLQSAELYIAEVRTNHSFSSFLLVKIVAFYAVHLFNNSKHFLFLHILILQ